MDDCKYFWCAPRKKVADCKEKFFIAFLTSCAITVEIGPWCLFQKVSGDASIEHECKTIKQRFALEFLAPFLNVSDLALMVSEYLTDFSWLRCLLCPLKLVMNQENFIS